jgi:tetratricopeptide (TPR) repeat protein
VNEQASETSDDRAAAQRVFISYATADRKEALSVCKALERRGTNCWLSSRDVAPGENYQEAIVRALRGARAMVLVFSEAANNSDEIKKELSLASRYHIPVMALRIEDVEPSDAFAYELSTRQWIDAFESWDKSIDALVRQIGQTSARGVVASTSSAAAISPRRASQFSVRGSIAGITAAVLLFAALGAWSILRPTPAAHSMMVRLTGFQRLSSDLPAGMPDAVRDELAAAFGDQGVVGVSTAAAPPPGPAPAYALGGTIRRDGNQIRVITRLTNERSGATLWSSSSNYDVAQVSHVPRQIAVGAAKMSRCGLFAASTYNKPLPDSVLADYMQYCQTAAVFQTAPQKALDSARKVVAAAPDFSWGWSAVTLAAAQSQYDVSPGSQREDIRRIGLQAADRALSLDSSNSEALSMKGMLIDPNDHFGQEKLLKQAIAARPLDCGCEHFIYGLILENVGRYTDAVEQFRRAVDMLALDGISQFALADSLTATGKQDEAKAHFDAVIDLAADPDWPDFIAIVEAPETGDYKAAVKALQNPKLQLPQPQRVAFLAGFQAMESGDRGAKARAIKMLLALPRDQQDPWAAKLLATLGDSHEALQLVANGMNSRIDWPSTLWYPSMRGALNDPSMPSLLERFGLMRYWKTTHTKPDVCSAKDSPPFCRMI